MQSTPVRASVYLVTGATGMHKSTFIRALAATRPASERWAIINNDADDDDDLVPEPPDAALTIMTVRGCACCTGQIFLQTAIVRILRQTRPQRLIIAASGAAEPAALERVLQQKPLAQAIQITHRLCVATAGQLESCPPATRDLWLRQAHAAESVITTDEAAVRLLRATLTKSGLPKSHPITTMANLLISPLTLLAVSTAET